MIFSDSSFSTAELEIGVLEHGCGLGNVRRRAAGVEMAGCETYFSDL